MGAKASSPANAANGRARAYSGSDLPPPSRTHADGAGTGASVRVPARRGSGGSGGGAGGSGGAGLLIGSLPAHLSPHLFAGVKCPVCSKFISSDEMELHLTVCLTKPRVTYNEDVLSKEAGECAICLEELQQGDTIARLPCLCIYHKGCIDEWFEVNRWCPEHPSD
ncbi:E3 ubiquitin-protein ligase znrf2 [Colossoma macropomum]|uniref:E3 ubiquitin-protein ligase znrf2 n=1 Tax=Colossoma macropomum TaxID=42526 RepID=UPI00186455EA|nr:E3 ubiquitin-protein ligase znrf2 [Colossoma macropomum]